MKFIFRRQKTLTDEQSAKLQKKMWLKEKEELEAAKIVKEAKRKELIFIKRQTERERLNQRLDVARHNFSIAQENLQKVLDKKDSKSEELLEQSSSIKVTLTVA